MRFFVLFGVVGGTVAPSALAEPDYVYVCRSGTCLGIDKLILSVEDGMVTVHRMDGQICNASEMTFARSAEGLRSSEVSPEGALVEREYSLAVSDDFVTGGGRPSRNPLCPGALDSPTATIDVSGYGIPRFPGSWRFSCYRVDHLADDRDCFINFRSYLDPFISGRRCRFAEPFAAPEACAG